MPPFSSGYQLKIIEGTGRGQVFPLDTKELTIGRAANPGERAPGYIFLYDDTVSRIHAQLLWSEEANQYVIHHRSQTNPTMINSLPLEEPHNLEPDDVIQIGKLSLQIQQIERRWAQNDESMRMRMPATAPSSTNDPGLAPLQSKRAYIPMPTETRKVAVRITMSGKGGEARTTWRFKVVEGPDAGKVLPLKGTMALGRATAGAEEEPNQILLHDDHISPEHALLRWSEPDSKYQLVPVASSIAIQRVIDGLVWLTTVTTTARLLLEPGDLLTMGHSRLEMQQVAVDEDTASLT